MKKIAVFASGGGTDFQSVIDANLAENFCEISVLIASKCGIGAIERAKRHGIRLYTVNFEFKAKRAGAADPENTVTIYKDEINIYGIPANTGLKGLLDDRFDLLICTCNGAEKDGTMPYPVEFVVKCCNALFKAGTGGRTSLFDMCVSGGKDGNDRKNDNAEQVEFLLHTLSTIKN